MSNLSPSQLQKNAILKDLQTLVNSGVLGSVFADDFSKANPFDRVWGNFPSVVIIPPILSGNQYEDQANNTREYTWYLMCVTTSENIDKDDPTYMEGLVDSIVALFDMDATLQGTANAGLYPTLLDAPGIINPPDSSTSYIVFFISFKARVLVKAGVQ